MEMIKIETIDKIFEEIYNFKIADNAKFRGQANAEWELKPKVGRPPFNKLDEKHLFNEWKRRASFYLNNPNHTDLEWLSIAQHYGLATKLLDWSANPLIALFFTCIDEPHRDGALYTFAPFKSVKISFDPFTEHNHQKPFLISTITTSNRLSNQAGYFTFHYKPEQNMETTGGEGILKKYLIPHELKKDITLRLHLLAINYVNIYPDLEGLSKHLNWCANNYEYWQNETI